jgi:hypothetical protein
MIVMNHRQSMFGIRKGPIFVTILYSRSPSLANQLQLKIGRRVQGMHLTNFSETRNPRIITLMWTSHMMLQATFMIYIFSCHFGKKIRIKVLKAKESPDSYINIGNILNLRDFAL